MTARRHLDVRLTIPQALAALNACDLIRDSYEADGQTREAAQYKRAADAIEAAIARHGGAP